MKTQGVITGVDHNLEWILPWWWAHYAAHNSYPVAFADFGMSPKALAFCKERGAILPIRKPPQEENFSKAFEKEYGKIIWQSRSAWFQKPLALLASPFDETLWLDADCKVQIDLLPLFAPLHLGIDILIAKHPEGSPFLQKEVIRYNSGVIAFRKKAPILNKWAKIAREKRNLLPGDEECLSLAIHKTKPRLLELSSLYNWLHDLGENREAFICHYCGPHGKIKALQELKNRFLLEFPKFLA